MVEFCRGLMFKTDGGTVYYCILDKAGQTLISDDLVHYKEVLDKVKFCMGDGLNIRGKEREGTETTVLRTPAITEVTLC